MPHDSVAWPRIAGLARPTASSRSEKSWRRLLVWRVRFWLLALGVGLVAANAHTDPAPGLAAAAAGKPTGCSVAEAKAARRFASVAWQHRPHGGGRAGLHCDPAVL